MLSKQLLQWHKSKNQRNLPWKAETDPYKIWLSEILLQQTQAKTVIPFYQKFIDHYPTISDLALANDQDVFAMWQGLGYYSRCRNLLATARIISNDYNGVFPNKFEDIIALPGIGNYTASAIASFAFHLPYAVLDGNVFRILARLLGSDTPIDIAAGKIFFQQKADELLPLKKPALYNQAIMDLGATICKPKQPLCPQCPWQKSCVAFADKSMSFYPVKSKKLIIKKRHFHYFVFDDGQHLYIKKRIDKDIWQDLHEFALQESDNEMMMNEDFNIETSPIIATQQLTHQKIFGYFYLILMQPTDATIKKYSLQKVNYQHIKNFAWPKLIVDFLSKQGYI